MVGTDAWCDGSSPFTTVIVLLEPPLAAGTSATTLHVRSVVVASTVVHSVVCSWVTHALLDRFLAAATAASYSASVTAAIVIVPGLSSTVAPDASMKSAAGPKSAGPRRPARPARARWHPRAAWC